MDIKLKIRGLEAFERMAQRAEREFALLPERMESLVDQGAQVLRQTDPFTDRSGRLRDSIDASIVRTSNGTTAILEMKESYARYVVASGWSNFEDVAENVREQMSKGIRAMNRRIKGR